MYRRIADIRGSSDAEDVIDEMIDRFGDIPPQAQELINVALVRSRAKQLGVSAVRQRDNHIMIYFTEIRCEGAAMLMEHIGKIGRRANLTMTGLPHIAVMISPGEAPEKAMKAIFDF